MMNKTESANEKRYHSVIVGSGPIGLLSTLSALKYCQESEKIAILSDRKDELGVRDQVLLINKDVYDFIEELVGKELMIQFKSQGALTEDPHSSDPTKKNHLITTGQMELLFLTGLKQQYTQGVDFDWIETKKIPPNTVDYVDAIQVDRKNQALQVVGVKHNDTPYKDSEGNTETRDVSLKFKYMVCADGAKRPVAKSMGSEVVSFVENQKKLTHSKHAVVTFRLPNDSNAEECLEKMHYAYEADVPEGHAAVTPSTLHDLQSQYEWNHNYRPYIQVYATNKDGICYAGLEVPDGLLKITNKEESRQKIREYARCMMRDVLPTDYIDKIQDPVYKNTEFDKKREMLSISAFDISLGEVNRFVIPCGCHEISLEESVAESTSGGIFIFGDAAKLPLYTTGTGVQTGIREVMCFRRMIQEDAENPENVKNHLMNCRNGVEAVLRPMRERQDAWVEKRAIRAVRSEKNCEIFSKLCILNEILQDIAQNSPGKLQSIEDRFQEIKETHHVLFSYLSDPKEVVDYNFIHINDLIEDLSSLSQEIRQIPVEDKTESVKRIENIVGEMTTTELDTAVGYRQRLQNMREHMISPSSNVSQPKH